MNLNEITEYIKTLPAWSIFVIFGVLVLVLLKIYFWIYFKNFNSLTMFTSVQTANEKLFLNKMVGWITLFISFVAFCFLSKRFTILVPEIVLILIWAIQLVYVLSSFPLFDQIISVKYTPYLLKEIEYFCLCGEIEQENGKYVFDSPFIEEKIELN